MNRQELEEFVIDLYHNQKKTFREIQKIVRKSPRDIKVIIDKHDPDRSYSLSASSQAYGMFKKGGNPIDVAIPLNLRDKEVSEFYEEYWNLNGIYQLSQIYEEIKEEGIRSIIELHRRTKEEGLSPQQVSRILKKNITLEYNNRNLEYEQARLEANNKQAAETFQRFTDLVQKDRKTIEENEYIIIEQKREIENLNIEKTRLENI